MNLFKPFTALHYNLSRYKDMGRLVCPPYDMMGPKEVQRFKRLSAHNFANVLCVDPATDYSCLTQLFHSWLEQRVLVEDTVPSLYLCEQSFQFQEKQHRRIGLVGLLCIDQDGIIYPHENTFASPKKDRYRILKALKTNLSPIFTIVAGRLPQLKEVAQKYRRRKAMMDFIDFTKISNRVWKITDKAAISSLCRAISTRKLFIADGHHRFEVARQYYKRMKDKFKDLNYILTYVTDVENGLLILPTHRVVTFSTSQKEVFSKLSQVGNLQGSTEEEIRNSLAHPEIIQYGMYVKNKFYKLTLKNKEILSQAFRAPQEKVFSTLPVAVFHKVLLSCLSVRNIGYTHSIEEAKKMVKGNMIAFLIPATSLSQMCDIASQGYRLPQKSTFFYPKLLSGVVMRRFG